MNPEDQMLETGVSWLSWLPEFPSFGLIIFLGIVLWITIAFVYRKVVPTNTVHIVQSHKSTTSYGAPGQAIAAPAPTPGTSQVPASNFDASNEAGNVYYRWPSWLPRIGVTVIEFSIANFELSLSGYEAYDKDRVPFIVDVTAFFRITNTTKAARRIRDMEHLREQLDKIVQGAVRKVLAEDVIDEIMLERSKFGESFTREVFDQLAEWGVAPVKNMELMDIRDTDDTEVIANIMAKKTSHIEMESRTEVANNKKLAREAEIAADQSVDIREQEAFQLVGERTAEKDKMIGVADEKAKQEIKQEARETAEKDMAVKKVEQVRQAEIDKDAAVVTANQDKEVVVLAAEGDLEAKKREAVGIEVEGAAKASAEQAMQLAPVNAQITLAEKISSLQAYMDYLIALKGVEGYIAVGSANAEALQEADIKVIATAGNGGASEGISSIGGLVSPNGGQAFAGMLEALNQSPVGREMLDAISGKSGKAEVADAGSTAKSAAASDVNVEIDVHVEGDDGAEGGVQA